MELIEPTVGQARGSFRSVYAFKKDEPYRHGKGLRLLDCLICFWDHESGAYFNAPGAGEFCVVDVVTKEKAWFELPFGATPETITAMIRSHFAADAFRVGDRLWFV